jgi:tyrosine-specific transport protein
MVSLTKTILLIFSITGSSGLLSSPPVHHIRTPARWTSTSHLFSRTDGSSASAASEDDDANTGRTKTTVASQAALIAGTTIGGGFLALPAATAPGGALPSAVGLVAVWTYLLGCSLSFANAIFLMKDNIKIEGTQTSTKDDEISIFSLVRECYGNIAGFLTGVLFLLLIKATLVAQLSKAGVLLQNNIPFAYFNREVWTILFSLIVTAVCLVAGKLHIERVNDVLTSTMLLSFATLVALASKSGWTIDGLRRANYKCLFPRESPWAVPIFIQLLLYNEVVPLVSSRLGDFKKVSRAIVFGSSIPLLMCLIWSCVALGIVPYEPALAATSGSAIYDPLSRLSQRVMSRGGPIGKIFLTSLNTMAGSAICTTVFGSILATTQYLDDVIATSFRARKDTSWTKIFKHAFAVFPSAMIAALGSSELYYHATAFAGEFPCTFLFGLIPPLCNLRLRWKRREKGEATPLKEVTVQIFLASVSVTLLAACRRLR